MTAILVVAIIILFSWAIAATIGLIFTAQDYKKAIAECAKKDAELERASKAYREIVEVAERWRMR